MTIGSPSAGETFEVLSRPRPSIVIALYGLLMVALMLHGGHSFAQSYARLLRAERIPGTVFSVSGRPALRIGVEMRRDGVAQHFTVRVATPSRTPPEIRAQLARVRALEAAGRTAER